MWSKEEARKKRVQFFTNFGIFMKKYIEVYDKKINWINYNTGVKAVYFKIEADNKTARIAIDIIHKDEWIRDLFYEQFEEFKMLLQSDMDPLTWNKEHRNSFGQSNIRIYTELTGYSMNNKEHWGDIYKFFEKNMTALHDFWDNTKEVFIDLEN